MKTIVTILGVAVTFIALSGCASNTAGTQVSGNSGPSFTSAERNYLADLESKNDVDVIVTKANQSSWVDLGHQICDGLNSQGVSAFMDANHSNYKLKAAAPSAIGDMCPKWMDPYTKWAVPTG